MSSQAILKWQEPTRATLYRLELIKFVDTRLVLAIISQESDGDKTAWNPEPRYPWLWDVRQDKPFRKLTDAEYASKEPPGDFPYLAGDRDQEWWGQQASWGLMQVMGAAAREQHFRGKYLPELVSDPYLDLEFGIKHLWNYAFQKGNRSTVDALNRWNGGGNPKYAAEVLNKRELIEANA